MLWQNHICCDFPAHAGWCHQTRPSATESRSSRQVATALPLRWITFDGCLQAAGMPSRILRNVGIKVSPDDGLHNRFLRVQVFRSVVSGHNLLIYILQEFNLFGRDLVAHSWSGRVVRPGWSIFCEVWYTTQPGNSSRAAAKQPGSQPSSQAAKQPASQPAKQPGCQPSSQAAKQPSSQPASQAGRQAGSQSEQQPFNELNNHNKLNKMNKYKTVNKWKCSRISNNLMSLIGSMCFNRTQNIVKFQMFVNFSDVEDVRAVAKDVMKWTNVIWRKIFFKKLIFVNSCLRFNKFFRSLTLGAAKLGISNFARDFTSLTFQCKRKKINFLSIVLCPRRKVTFFFWRKVYNEATQSFDTVTLWHSAVCKRQYDVSLFGDLQVAGCEMWPYGAVNKNHSTVAFFFSGFWLLKCQKGWGRKRLRHFYNLNTEKWRQHKRKRHTAPCTQRRRVL